MILYFLIFGSIIPDVHFVVIWQVVNRHTNSDGNYLSNENTLRAQYSFESININGVESTSNVAVDGEPRSFLFKRQEDLTTAYAIDVNNGFSTDDTDASILSLESGDAVPLYIRPAFFMTKQILQTSPFPCDNNNVLLVNDVYDWSRNDMLRLFLHFIAYHLQILDRLWFHTSWQICVSICFLIMWNECSKSINSFFLGIQIFGWWIFEYLREIDTHHVLI